MPPAAFPATRTNPAGTFTPWIDVKKFAGAGLHGRMNRAGGKAEFPNITADFTTSPKAERVTVVIELATGPSEAQVVKRWRESFRGSLTSFLVSPNLARDADELETAAEMAARRLRWAKEATGGKRHSPKSLIVQTSFWSPQRPELNLQEAETLRLLGFNVIGNQRPEVREQFEFVVPGHTHGVRFGPAATREQIKGIMSKQAERFADQAKPSPTPVPFGLADEVCCRPIIGDDAQALAHFHAWLATQPVSPRDLGVSKWSEVVPIETPVALREREKKNGPAARRVFYFTSRFRQHAATERVRWHTETFHNRLQELADDKPIPPTWT
ncbi:MAG: hypothetical protein N2C14_24430, partial [Planctomycetales bacterium]